MEPPVAAHQREHDGSVRRHHRHRLGGGARVDPEELGERIDRLDARRRHLLGRRVRRKLGLRDAAAGLLDVRGVVAAITQRDLVLARRRWRHVLVRAGAAHVAGVGLDLPVRQPAAIEDAPVGDLVQGVGRVETLAVAIERVGVLHRELAGAKHPAGRTRLVALLRLDVVPDLREVAP